MVVSVCALAATLWQGDAIQKHNRLMVQPILDTEINVELDGTWTIQQFDALLKRPAITLHYGSLYGDRAEHRLFR